MNEMGFSGLLENHFIKLTELNIELRKFRPSAFELVKLSIPMQND